MYKDFGLHKLFERIDHEREDELSHARVLIARTLFLQGKPNVAKRVPIVVGENVRAMLASDLEVEYRVGNLLKKWWPTVRRAGLRDAPGTDGAAGRDRE